MQDLLFCSFPLLLSRCLFPFFLHLLKLIKLFNFSYELILFTYLVSSSPDLSTVTFIYFHVPRILHEFFSLSLCRQCCILVVSLIILQLILPNQNLLTFSMFLFHLKNTQHLYSYLIAVCQGFVIFCSCCVFDRTNTTSTNCCRPTYEQKLSRNYTHLGAIWRIGNCRQLQWHSNVRLADRPRAHELLRTRTCVPAGEIIGGRFWRYKLSGSRHLWRPRPLVLIYIPWQRSMTIPIGFA